MARRRKQDEALVGLVLLLAVAAFVVFVASVCLPLLLIGGYLYYRLKRLKHYSSLSGTCTDFWLSSNEKQQFIQLATVLFQSQRDVAAAHERGAQAGLERNLDGRFSARTKIGKEIRHIEENHELLLSEYLTDYEFYRDLPRSKWSEFRETLVREKSMLSGLSAWIVSAVGLFGFVYVTSSSNSSADHNGTSAFYVVTVVCALISVGAFFAYRLIDNDSAEQVSPRPGEVTLENVNSY